MKKIIPPSVKEAVQKATEAVLEETKEVDEKRIYELLITEYNLKFYNLEVLKKLIQDALNEIVFIYC